MCDVIVDKAALEAIYQKGKQAKVDVLKRYAEDVVLVADIKIAIRAARTGKNKLFLQRALASCDSIDLEKLTTAALMGTEAVCSFTFQNQDFLRRWKHFRNLIPVLRDGAIIKLFMGYSPRNTIHYSGSADCLCTGPGK